MLTTPILEPDMVFLPAMDDYNVIDRRFGSSYCRSGYTYSRGRCVRNRWTSWGRWLLVGLVIAAALFFLLCCG